MTLNVVIADDQHLVRTGFRMILTTEPDIDVVGEAGDGAEAVALVRELRPDVALIDIRMPDMDGIEATRQIAQLRDSPTRVLILTTFDLDEYVFAALRAGASGFLLKDVPATELATGIRTIAAGEALLAPSITRRLIKHYAATTPRPSRPPELERLTPRERDVLQLLAQGMSNAEIAAYLVVGETTVKTHITRLLAKLGLRDRVQAVVFVYRSGLADAGDPAPQPEPR